MPLWGRTDDAGNSAIFAAAQVNKTPNTANRTALYQNTTPDAFITDATVGVYNVSEAEQKFSNTRLLVGAEINESGNSGSYEIGDILTITKGSATEQVQAQIEVKTLTIRTATVNAVGSGYANGDTLTIGDSGCVLTVTTGESDDEIASLAITDPGEFTETPSGSQLLVNIESSGEDGTVDLEMDPLALAVVNPGRYLGTSPTAANNALTTANDYSDGEGVTADLTFQLTEAEAARAGAVGWCIRTEGSGGRAGRVSYECLVALGETANAETSDDAVLPQ